jgi:hypothetical protein
MAVYGLTCVFLYLVPAIIFLVPTLVGFVASTLAYVFNPDLADNGVYTGVVIVLVFWTGVFMSARGGTGGIAKLASSGLLVGTLIPGAILVILCIIGLITYSANEASAEAQQKAEQLANSSIRPASRCRPTWTSSSGRSAPTAGTSATTRRARSDGRCCSTRSPTAPTSSAAGRSSSTPGSSRARR